MTYPVFDPEKLVEFIQELHRLGFVFSTEQYTAAQDLLITLVAQGRAPADPQNLSSWLAPILCTSAEEQRIFPEVFKQWLERQPQAEPEIKEPENQAIVDSQPIVKDDEKPFNRNWLRLIIITGSVLLIVVIAIIFVKYDLFRAPLSINGTIVNEEGNPVRKAQVKIEGRETLSDERGYFLLTNTPRNLPIEITVSHNEYEVTNRFLSDDILPLTITLTKLAVPRTESKEIIKLNDDKIDPPDNLNNKRIATLQRHFRSWSEIYRNFSKLALVGTLLLPLLLFGAVWLRRIYALRRLRLMKQSSDEEYSLHSLMVKGATDQLFRGQALRRIAQELRRHRQFGSNEIDPPPTVNATIREGGWFKPVYGLRREQPEYLALIDRASLDDHQAQLEDALITRLIKDGVIVERYYFRGSPLVCRKEDPKASHIELQELRALYPNHILLLFSDGDGLINTSSEPQRWLDMMTNWSIRALLTPKELSSWGYHEWALSEQGFVVIPASKEGIAALIETIHTSATPRIGNANKSKPFPEMLKERPWRWMERHEPKSAVVNQLCFQLRRFLGEDGYHLLGACAVYPMLYWKLTLYLGYKLGGTDDLEDKLRSLVRLPWFRHGSIPDWLRLRLISALPKKHEELTRQALIKLLESSLNKPYINFFTLPYAKGDDQNGDEPGRKGFWNGFVKGAQAWNRGRRWQDLIRLESKHSPLRDYVFLTFMSGRKPQRLSLNLPDALRQVISPEGPVALGIRSFIGLLFAILYIVVAFLAVSARLFEVSVPISYRVATGYSDTVYSVAFSPDGKKLASGSGDENVTVWDYSGTILPVLEKGSIETDSALSLTEAVSPDGKTLARISDDNRIKIWDMLTGKLLITLTGHSGPIYSLAFSPDSKLLASGSQDTTVKLWRVSTGKDIAPLTGRAVATLTGHAAAVYFVTFLPGSDRLLSRSSDGKEKTWNVETHQLLTTSDRGSEPVYSIAYSPDTRVFGIAIGRGDKIVKLMRGGREATLSRHTGPVYSVAFSPDGNMLASGSWDKTVELWDVSTGTELATLRGHSDIVTSVAFSPSGKVLASGSRDQTIRIWDLNTEPGRYLSRLRGHSEIVYSVAFSPDSKVLASASGDNSVKLWDLSMGEQLATLTGHLGPVYSVAFSPDGKTVASGSSDNKVKLWNVNTGKEIATLIGHTGIVTSVAFSPDSKTVASSSSDRTVMIWDLTGIIE